MVSLGAHPVPREGVVIIAATRGQHYLGDNGLGHGPDPSGPRSPFGARCGHHGRVCDPGAPKATGWLGTT